MTVQKSGKASKISAAFHKTMREALLAGALPGENEGFGVKAQKAASNFILSVAQKRKAQSANIVAESFTNEDGRLSTRIVIINGDMPFLVDSASGLISGLGIDIERLIHPILCVERDASGVLKKLYSLNGKTESARESFIYFETGRLDSKQRHNIEKALQEIMRDVRAAVKDWPKLRKKLQDNAALVKDKESGALLKWFGQNNFTMLGHERLSLDGVRSEKLGLSRASDTPMLSTESVDLAIGIFKKSSDGPLILKANRASTVHRNVLLDLIVVPILDGKKLIAISIISGLWTSAALATNVSEVPVLRSGFEKMLTKFGFNADSHAGKAMGHMLTALPHDLLVTFHQDDLERITLTAMSLTDRPRTKLLTMRSPLGRHIFGFAWVPRDEISTNLRRAVLNLVADAAQANILGWTISLEDGGLALIRFTLDLPDRDMIVDEQQLDHEFDLMVRGWEPAVENILIGQSDEKRAAAMVQRYGDAFPNSYRNDYSPLAAANDMLALINMERDNRRVTRFYKRDGDGEGEVRLKIYNAGGAMPLSDAVPVLENFGFLVKEERPTALDDGALGYIHDFCLETEGLCCVDDIIQRADILEQSLSDVLDGKAEDDEFNKLISLASLSPNAVIWLRAWFRYLRQTGLAYGLPTVVAALAKYPAIAEDIIALFDSLHNPVFKKDRGKASAKLSNAITHGLESVSAIDDDRILRLITAVVRATLRTNAFTVQSDEALAFKIESANVPGLPKPLPWREIWVYSPRVEGIHLRAGPVARGGLRWSDRRDDFRTEILGLMKAQRVKNAVIVPTGAKGGFYPKALPDMRVDRNAWIDEGTESYRIFIRSLLSITDNIVAGKVTHPKDVVIRDEKDPYFVVAADKGTASFSDVANAIAIERGFWLGDAFASGGSVGYDHKAMGITAKGGWVSVQRHFKEMGLDIQSEAVTVAGVGDMSGDVFGNGMLLSKAIKLVAAFDHRHIFIDPDPDPAKSWKERERLFNLPRSSWDDYNKKLISKGGGVFSRSLKRISTTPAIRELLDIEEKEIEPSALMRAILKAQVGLLWFGGIGTYIKHANESNADVGDRSNDALRIDADEVRANVLGEGANLGVTQDGRISFALNGGRVNADFIDNSAGVDCSDNEVNIKIALNNEMREGRLQEKARNILLEKMTDEVSEIVLKDNYLQAQALSVAEAGGASDLPAYVRLIETFESQGRLDREVEGLAGNDDLLRRAKEGKGLTRPELAVLLSTAKLTAQDAAEETGLYKDEAFASEVLNAFPKPMQRKHKQAILDHQLRKEIIATKMANRMINRLGLLHPFELAEEEGCSLATVIEAFAISEKLLGMDAIWQRLDDAAMPETVRMEMFDQFAIELRAHMADIIRNSVKSRKAGMAIETYAPILKKMISARRKLLSKYAKEQSEANGRIMIAKGLPNDIADEFVKLIQIDGVFGLAALANKTGGDVNDITRAFIHLGEATGIIWTQNEAMRLDPNDPWERLLVAGVARDFQTMRLDFIASKAAKKPVEQVQKWLKANEAAVSDFHAMVDRAAQGHGATPAMLAQIAGQARNLLG